MSIKRNENESFADYKERRANYNIQSKLALKPVLFHDSYYEGTYTNPEKREYKRNNTKHGRKQQAKGN